MVKNSIKSRKISKFNVQNMDIIISFTKLLGKIC